MRERLSQERWRHTLSVAETSYRIATALNWPAHERERVMLAALLHDVAKELPAESQLQLAGISSEQVDGKGPLLHALAGAALASREYDVADEGVLEAIACHPTGSAGEAPLVQLLFVADYLEPLRPHLDGEDRDLLERALAGGLALPALFCRVLEKKIARVRARGLPVHPRSVAAWRAHCERRG